MRHFQPWLLKAGFSEQFVKDHFVRPRHAEHVAGAAGSRAGPSEGQLAHGDHPVLSMCASNTVIAVDDAGNRKPSKKRSA
ncbi:MAG TPA: hypothetical protein VKB78_11735, partial [Pirellulales bacterium]|nr:hypothetical protein [Pirellulales bacterium]